MDYTNRLLVVDDDEVGRRALCFWLEASGYEPTEACDGMDALIRLQTGSYALVITDYRMPGMNGIELLRIVRKKWKIPVLLISGDLNEAEEQIAKLNHACVLRKPIERDDLLPIVNLAVQRGHLGD